MSTFTLSLEYEFGQSEVHGFHLGTIERVARQIAEEKMQTCRDNGWPMVTMALIQDGKIFDVLYRDGTWHNQSISPGGDIPPWNTQPGGRDHSL